MPGRIEDYAMVGDLQTAALVCLRRFRGLAVLPPLRFAGLLRRIARRRRQRPLAYGPHLGRPLHEAPLQGAHARPGDRVGDPDRRREGDRLHAAPRCGARPGSGSRGRKGQSITSELRARFDYVTSPRGSP